VANGCQKDVDADRDPHNNNGEQANEYEKNAGDFHVATGDCQHRGHSVSFAGRPRNITDTDYGGAEDRP
jgi:hypothetical protein